jgi:voltage-gated potassium channel Kch
MPNSIVDLLKRLWRHQWAIVSGMAAIAFMLGIAGLYRLQTDSGSLDRWSWGDAVYFSLRLFGFNYDLGGDGHVPYAASNWQLRVACFLAPASLALAVYKAVMLAAADTISLLWVSFWKDHAVVCGAGERGKQLAISLRSEGRRVVVIEKNRDCDTLTDIRRAGAKVVVGSVTDPAIQSAARLDRAKTVVALTPCCESNLQVVLAASNRTNGRPLQALAYAPRAFTAMFEGQAPFKHIEHGIECGFFDDNASSARQLVAKYIPSLAGPLFHERRPARILVAGDGEIIPELLGMLVSQCHFGGSEVPFVKLLTVDEDAVARSFPLHHPQMSLVANVRVSQMGMAKMSRVEIASITEGTAGAAFDLIFVACHQDADTLTLATNLAQQLAGSIDVVACLAPSTRLTDLFKTAQPLKGITIENLVTVGCRANDVLRNELDHTAMRIHKAYYEEQKRLGKKDGETFALRPWEELRADFRQANRSQADHRMIQREILALSQSDETVELLAEAEHLRWTADRIVSGWRYSDTRSDEKRLHPSIRPYRELSEDDKNKDRGAVRSALEAGPGT